MAPQQRQLPLFPLHVVLFPNSVLPLHIFEERYQLMVQRCLDGDSQFGVVLIKLGSDVGDPAEPYSVGTVARIVQVQRLENGRMLMNVSGQERFRITEITQVHPYIEGQVEILEEEGEPDIPASELQGIRKVVSRHISLMLGFRGGWVREAKMPGDPEALSYFAAALLQSELPRKQELLEEPSTTVRLRNELQMLDQEAEELRAQMVQRLRLRISRQ